MTKNVLWCVNDFFIVNFLKILLFHQTARRHVATINLSHIKLRRGLPLLVAQSRHAKMGRMKNKQLKPEPVYS